MIAQLVERRTVVAQRYPSVPGSIPGHRINKLFLRCLVFVLPYVLLDVPCTWYTLFVAARRTLILVIR